MKALSLIDPEPLNGDAARRYRQALIAYARNGGEADLLEAYECARAALQAQVAISDIGEIHFHAARELRADSTDRELTETRLEAFYLEAVSVYDMALRGYGASVATLTNEIAERRRAEEELRKLSGMLTLQRDQLDQQVRARTAELQNKVEELRALNSQLRQTNQEQSQFTYALSHDLKSPVNTMTNMLDFLASDYQDCIDEDGQELIFAARTTAARMSRIIADTLCYSQLVGLEPRFEPVDLAQLCKEVLADLRADIDAAQAKVHVGALPVIRGLPTQLRSLLQNLISNGLKFRAPDRPCVLRIEATSDVDDCEVEVSVRDNGIGIAAAQQERIFGLFQRLHTHDDYPGTGIGLALCQRVAHVHGGSVQVQSEPGKGSCFSVRFWGAGT
jgi:hypothetical protein